MPARGGWDTGRLHERFPVLDAGPRHRLGDLAPFVWPVDGSVGSVGPVGSVEPSAGGQPASGAAEILLFTCRWPTDEPVPLWLDAAADAAQRAVAARAIDTVMRSSLGLELELRHFDSASAGPWSTRSGITLEWVAGPGSGGGVSGTGDAVADCRVDEVTASDRSPGLHAYLVRASVRVATARTDPLGRLQQLDEVDLFAALLHELGHALGFASHTAVGDSLLRESLFDVRRLGRRAWEGAPAAWPALEALYAIPSGTVVGRHPLPRSALREVGLLAAAARERGLDGPFTRAGQHSAEIFWRAPPHRYALVAPRTDWPEQFRFRPNVAAATALHSRDRGP